MAEVVSTAPVVTAPEAPATPADVVTDDQKPAAEAPAPKGDEKKPDTPDLAEKKQGQSRFDRKIGRLTREKAEAQARAEFYEKQFNEAKAQRPAAATPAEGAPTLAQFDYDPEKYATALAKYETDRARKEDVEKQRSESARQEQQRLVSGWAEKVEKGDAKYEDFDEKVGDLTKHINIPAVAAIIEADNAEDLAYYFGSNPKEFERIVQLAPRSQVREIGKLEAKLLAEPPKPKTPSSAPAPIKPVGGSNAASTKKLIDMDQDEFEKRRRAQIAQRR
jgi:hypothetical protein